jgi:fatty acid desaturase
MAQNRGELPAGSHAQVTSEPVSARAAKDIVADLLTPNPAIYWLDLIVTISVTYSCGAVYLLGSGGTLAISGAFVVAAIGLFRIGTFMHELVHFRKNSMRGFKLGWNLLAGIPLLMPSLLYTSHADHHSNRYYGTPADGEYLPFGATPVAEIFRFFAMVPILAPAAVARFLFIAPISFLHPAVRRFVLERLSAAAITPYYRRRNPPALWDRYWLATDIACFLYALTMLMLVVNGTIALAIIGKLYVLISFAHTLNWFRTLAAHRYRNHGAELSHSDQVLDSINVVGSPVFNELLFPVGLRYHALHHLLPSIPYHALGEAHRRLMLKLPENSSYRLTACNSIVEALRQLWRDARASEGLQVMEAWRRVT